MNRSLDKRVRKLESRSPDKSLNRNLHIIPYDFYDDEDTQPIIEEYCQRNGIDPDDETNMFVTFGGGETGKYGWNEESL